MDTLSINALRMLGAQAVNQANSGHPGMLLGSAPAAYSLFTKELIVYPKESKWINRDRFVLASGHVSSLLYSLLHVSGFDVTIDDLKHFRQLGSRTPGHPEFGMTDGVDASSGPLGQGVATAVGMAMAEKIMAERFNRPDYPVIDHYTYALCGDGDMQEGVLSEAISLAGHLALGKLILMYDANDVTLDGAADMSTSEDIKKKFEACQWQVIVVEEGMNPSLIAKALKKAKKEKYKPTLIMYHTVIGYGSTNQGTSKVHGNPLGKDIEQTAAFYKWTYKPFEVPTEVYDDFHKNVFLRGKRHYQKWTKMMKAYKVAYPELSHAFEQSFETQSFDDYLAMLPSFEENSSIATRDASQKIVDALATSIPNYITGSADLASSVKNHISFETRFSKENYSGRNIYYGIREFAMTSIANGMMLHQGLRVSIGGFFIFSDYMKPAIRLAALSHIPVIYQLSHDSIAVGEDGPTHQPIEQMMTLRNLPNFVLFRPADAKETNAAYAYALSQTSSPVAILLSRQPLVVQPSTNEHEAIKGAYIVSHEQGNLDVCIVSTGSEVGLAIEAAKMLQLSGIGVRVVSMPSMECFNQQPLLYRQSIIPRIKHRVAIEMGSTLGWERYVGEDGLILGMHSFGESAPMNDVLDHFGFNVEQVVNKIERYLKED